MASVQQKNTNAAVRVVAFVMGRDVYESVAIIACASETIVAPAPVVILPVLTELWTELMNALSWLMACPFRPCWIERIALFNLSVRLLICPLLRPREGLESWVIKALDACPGGSKRTEWVQPKGGSEAVRRAQARICPL